MSASVGDDAATVMQNRLQLMETAGLPEPPRWLEQVHGSDVISAGDHIRIQRADACVTDRLCQVCAVLTADCLPILLCNTKGTRVAAVHVGWRGLAAGVVESAVEKLLPGEELMAWMGPGIGASAYTVGPEVRDTFIADDADAATAFESVGEDRWNADLPELARQRLHRCGISQIYASGLCTYSDPFRFFSYRRDGVTGRMATLIWIAPTNPG